MIAMKTCGPGALFTGCDEAMRGTGCSTALLVECDAVRDTLTNIVESAYEHFNPYEWVFETLSRRPDFQSLERSYRFFCTKFYSWAVPNQEALECIAEFGPILEVGAGTGYWAHMLEKLDVDVVAVDRHPPHPSSQNAFGHVTRFTQVRRGNSRSPLKYPGRTLMLCWPPYRRNLAYDALTYYSGEYLIFIGEQNGCTGNWRFFEELDTNWKHVRYQSIPQWPGMCDGLSIYRRK